jgi:hypothetical protein
MGWLAGWAERGAGPRARGGGGGLARLAAGWATTRWAEPGERGEREGAAGPAELGQGGSWAEIYFSFLFLFLSLFYLFQFDIMRKQMIR